MSLGACSTRRQKEGGLGRGGARRQIPLPATPGQETGVRQEVGGRGQETGGRWQEAGCRGQYAGGRRQEAAGARDFFLPAGPTLLL